jgi:hypothetical protein
LEKNKRNQQRSEIQKYKQETKNKKQGKKQKTNNRTQNTIHQHKVNGVKGKQATQTVLKASKQA